MNGTRLRRDVLQCFTHVPHPASPRLNDTFCHSAPQYLSPKGAAYHSEGLPSLSEATLVHNPVTGKQTQHASTPHADQQRLQ